LLTSEGRAHMILMQRVKKTPQQMNAEAYVCFMSFVLLG
jgi:hypothetical protein